MTERSSRGTNDSGEGTGGPGFSARGVTGQVTGLSGRWAAYRRAVGPGRLGRGYGPNSRRGCSSDVCFASSGDARWSSGRPVYGSVITGRFGVHSSGK